MAETANSMPNPTEAKTAHQFREKLKSLRNWAGDPPFQRMEELSGERPAEPGRRAVARSTASEILKRPESDNRLPDEVFVAGFVRACMLFRSRTTAPPAEDTVAQQIERWVSVLHDLRTAGTAVLDEGKPPKRNALIGWISRHKVLTGTGAGIAAVSVALLVFAGTGALGSDDSETAEPTTNPSARGRATSPSTPVAACDTYEVRARDLWLRDEYGGPLSDPAHGQLLQGTRVTLLREANSLGQVEVKADDGRMGRIDPRYLKPVC